MNTLGQLIPIAVTVVAIPVVVRGLGIDKFGILALTGILAGYFQIFDLGLNRAVVKSVSEAFSRDELLRIKSVVHTAFVAEIWLGLAAGFLLTATTPFLVESILHIPDNLRHETLQTLRMLSLSLPPLLATGSVRALLEAAQRFDLVNAVGTPAAIASALVPLLGVHLGWDLPDIVALQVVLSVIGLIIYAGLAVSLFPALKEFPGFSSRRFLDLLTFGGWITLSNTAGPVLLYTDRFLIGALLTVADVAYYSVPFQVITRLWIIPTGLVMALFPAFATYARRRDSVLHQLYFRSIKYLMLQAGPVILVLTIFGGDVLRLWLGAEFARNAGPAFKILLLGAFVGLLAPVPGIVLQGIGRPDVISKLYALYLPLNTFTAWILIRHFGLVGAALSYALRTSLDSVLLLIISVRTLRLSWTDFQEQRLLWAIGLVLGSGIPLWLISQMHSTAARVSLAATWMISLAIVTWRFALDTVDRQAIVTLLGKTRL